MLVGLLTVHNVLGCIYFFKSHDNKNEEFDNPANSYINGEMI